MAASLDVVNLLGGVGLDASCLVFDFPGENLSPTNRMGDDNGFNVVSLEASPWKSCGPASPVEEQLDKRLKF
jgi:hypothetical protein